MPTAATSAVTSSVVVLGASNFDLLVLKGERPALVEFYATWCTYCQRMVPIVDQVATRYEGRALVGKVDVDAQRALAAQWRVGAYPTFVVFRDGKEFARQVGTATEGQLAALLDAAAQSRAGEGRPNGL